MTEAIASAPIPAVIIELASERIVVTNSLAQAMLAPVGDAVTGRKINDLFADRPSGGLDLLRAGRLRSYATTRALRQGHAAPTPVQVWVQAGGQEAPPRFAVAVIATIRTWTGLRLPSLPEPELTPVVGTTDEGLMIDRISSDVEALLGYPAAGAIGRSILSLMDQVSVANLLEAIAEVAAQRAGVTVDVVARSQSGKPILLEAALWPLNPAPRCAFALLPRSHAEPAPGVIAEMDDRMSRLARAIGAVGVSRYLSGGPRERDLPGLSRLTTRELDIVSRLASGDRVPAIAGALFISQGTVRNHLLSVYRKLGVHSQQELIHAFRR